MATEHDKQNEFSQLCSHVESPALKAAALKASIDYVGFPSGNRPASMASRADSALGWQELKELRQRMGDWP